MATRNPSKNSALKLVPKTPRTKATAANREAIIQKVLDATCDDILTLHPPKEVTNYFPDTKRTDSHDENLVNNYFAYGASQVNTDLAVAAECEACNDFGPQDNDWLDFCISTEYGKLRRTFLEDVKANLAGKTGRVDPLLNAVYRAYYAGMLSPERKEPYSTYDRIERHRRRDEFLKIPATK
jgi:hypothetical protein